MIEPRIREQLREFVDGLTLERVDCFEYRKSYVELFNSVSVLRYTKAGDFDDMRYCFTWLSVEEPVITANAGSSWYYQPCPISDNVDEFRENLSVYGRSMTAAVFNYKNKSPRPPEKFASRQIVDCDSDDWLGEMAKPMRLNTVDMEEPLSIYDKHEHVYLRFRQDQVLCDLFPSVDSLRDWECWIKFALYLFCEKDGRYISAITNAISAMNCERARVHAVLDARGHLEWFRSLVAQYAETLFAELEFLTVKYEEALSDDLDCAEKLLADGLLIPISDL